MTKQLLRNFLTLLIPVGILIALWPAGQSLYARWNQRQLHEQWKKSEEKTAQLPKTPEENPGQKQKRGQDERERTKAKTQPQSQSQKLPWKPTRLIIPDADVDAIVLSGWDESTLKRAPGHWPASALPGQPGNCAIAGHRNVYGSPFYRVDQLQPGAPIELRTGTKRYYYRVIEVKAVFDTDTTVLQPSPDPTMPPLLTLVTCTIPRTSNRIIVSAGLVK